MPPTVFASEAEEADYWKTVVKQCDRCRHRELSPIGEGVWRDFGGQRMKLCDRCCIEVFGRVLPLEGSAPRDAPG